MADGERVDRKNTTAYGEKGKTYGAYVHCLPTYTLYYKETIIGMIWNFMFYFWKKILGSVMLIKSCFTSCLFVVQQEWI